MLRFKMSGVRRPLGRLADTNPFLNERPTGFSPPRAEAGCPSAAGARGISVSSFRHWGQRLRGCERDLPGQGVVSRDVAANERTEGARGFGSPPVAQGNKE